MLASCNVEYIQDILSTLNNQFWKYVLKSFLDINYKTEICEEQILKSPLFYNRNIKIDRKNVFYKTWYDKGIRFVNDLVNQNGSFYSYQETLSITYTNKINQKSTSSIHTKSYQSFSATKVRDTSNV